MEKETIKCEKCFNQYIDNNGYAFLCGIKPPDYIPQIQRNKWQKIQIKKMNGKCEYYVNRKVIDNIFAGINIKRRKRS